MLSECLISLEKGFPVIFPTETVYGIGTDIFNDDAVDLLYRIKKRDPKKPFSLHYHKIDIIYKYAIVNDKIEKIIKNFLPGPLTLVLNAKSNAPHNVVRNYKIGIRIVANDKFYELMERYKNPIVGTSVNEAGELPLLSPYQIKTSPFSIYPIIKDGIKSNKPSTVLDCTVDPFIIIRSGDNIKELESYL
jgi:L-threonylcarbamoyladenylate synthase